MSFLNYRRTRSTGGRSRWRAIGAIGVAMVSLAATATVPSATTASAGTTNNWSSYLYGPGHSSYNPNATAITTANASSLEPVWRWIPPKSPNAGPNQILATPTIVNGVIYVGVADGYFYAVDEATQTILWSQFLGLIPAGLCGNATGIISTASVQPDPVSGNLTVYVNAPDGYLYAMDAATGNVNWKSVVGIPSATVQDYYAWGSPLVANGKVYIGISSDCDAPLVRGGVVAVDQVTGSQLAKWISIPAGQRGGSVWSTPALLPDGSILVTTGNANTPTQPLYNDSVVRLDPSTLHVLDAFQVAPGEQIADGDFGASPTVFTATIGGVATPMVGACNKNGIYYGLRQGNLSAGSAWETRITDPYGGFVAQCDSAAIWDGTQLIETGGQSTTINGVAYQGSIQALDPATGKPLWQTGLPGDVLGSPSENGSGVVAAAMYITTTANYGVYLFDAGTGAILGVLPADKAGIFSQPIFVGNDLIISGPQTIGITAYEVPAPGPTVTSVLPAVLRQNTTQTLVVHGSGFSGQPTVFVSNTLAAVTAVHLMNSSTLNVTVTTNNVALLGPRDLVVVEPGPTIGVCSSCLTVDPKPPWVTGASPGVLDQGQTKTIQVTGYYFQPGATVSIGSGVTAQTTFVNSNQLSALLTSQPTTPTGSYRVTVTNPDGGTSACVGCLAIVADPAPTVTGVSPSVVGQQGTDTLTVNGTDFTSASSVALSNSGIHVLSVHDIDDGHLSVSVSVDRLASLTPSDVTVSTVGGTAACLACLALTLHPVSGVFSGPLIHGATTTITVKGANYQPGLTVATSIPGATGTSVTGVTATSFKMTVTVPSTAGLGKEYRITVVNPDGGTGYLSGLTVA